uniref:CKLF like MARVEL transmembrane domain containing 1 n=1 Tax=Saimiri boliviensis boliviensis TaxID=39432 RepID=A0A2K6T7S7_SAIBB
MNPEDTKPESSKAPSGSLKQPETATALASGGSVVSSVPKARRDMSAKTAPRKHSAVSVRTVQSVAPAGPKGSEGTAPSRKATKRPPPTPTPPPPTPSAPTESKLLNETAIKERAEGRAKVPYKFRDSLKRFFFSPTGMLKILRMVSGKLDLTNSIITAAFLSVVAFLAMQEKKRRHLFYVGGSLCLTAIIVCGIDAFVVTKTMRTNLKKFLGVEVESKVSPAGDAYPETGPDAPKRPA